MSTSVVLAYFNHNKSEKIKTNFLKTVKYLKQYGVELSVAQVCKHHERPLEIEDIHSSEVYHSNDLIFFKENLWNLAAKKTTGNNIVFLDADTYYKSDNWLDEIEKQLSTYDVIQPFDDAMWEEQGGNIGHKIRKSWMSSQVQDITPIHARNHCGFGFAIRRSLFDSIGGFYDRACIGHGDALFCVAFTKDQHVYAFMQACNRAIQSVAAGSPDPEIGRTIMINAKQYLCPSYLEYREQCQSKGAKVGYLPGCTIFHRWHGDDCNRRYEDRLSLVDWRGDSPVHYRDDGLVEWSHEQPRVHEWWDGRDDDGLDSGVKASRYAPTI